MVFILRDINSGTTAVLGRNNTYTFGRSRMNNIQLKDYTCSNRHAKIEVKDGVATLIDVGSKSGTFVNKRRIEERKLIIGDIICFGLNHCIYKFFDPEFQTMLDQSVSEDNRIALQETLTRLNVNLAENYSRDCTHYTTNFVNLNTLKETKLIDTLIDKKPVVTVKFWDDMLRNLEEGVEIPNIYKCLPEIDNNLKEKGVQSILPRKKRSTLFKDTACIFFDNGTEFSLKNLIIKCDGEIIQHDGEANFATTLENHIKFAKTIIVSNVAKEKQTLVERYFIDKMKQCYTNVEVLEPDDIYIILLNGYWPNAIENEMSNNRERCNGSKSAQSGPSNINPVSGSNNGVALERPNACPREKSLNTNRTKSQNTKLTQWISISKKNLSSPSTSQTSRVRKRNGAFNFSLSMSSEDSDSSVEIMEAGGPSLQGQKDSSNVQSTTPVVIIDSSDDDETSIEAGPSGLISHLYESANNKNQDVVESASTSESPEIFRKTRCINTPCGQSTNHLVMDTDDSLTSSETPNIAIKMEQSITPPGGSTSPNKNLKINPLARLKRKNLIKVYPSLKSPNKNAVTDVEQCKKLFTDVEFIPL